MGIIKSDVPVQHLATEMGDPNRLKVNYSTDVLLPLAGPYLVARLRRDFLKALLVLNDFFLLVRDFRTFRDAGGELDLRFKDALITPRSGDRSSYGQSMARSAMDALRELRADGEGGQRCTDEKAAARLALLSRLAAPNEVFRELHDAGLVGDDCNILSPEFEQAETFEDQVNLVLGPLLSQRKRHVPADVTPFMTEIAQQTFAEARQRHTAFLSREFEQLGAVSLDRTIKWMAAWQASRVTALAAPFLVDVPDLGFAPNLFVREWAYTRKERMTLVFGTPDLRGPVNAEPVPPKGFFKREDYTSSRHELTAANRELRRTTSRETQSFGSRTLRRALDRVYYSGAGALDQLTSQASHSLLREERRAAVLSIVQEVSEERESTLVDVTGVDTSTTVTRKAVGVDDKRAATHHRFKVVVPIEVTVEMYDVGLTWAPRIFNPFFELRQAIWKVYHDARTDHMQRYYVPEPNRPPIVWDQFIASTSIVMEGEESATAPFTIVLQPSDREQRADLDNARVTWNQDESFWNDDPDHFIAVLQNLAFDSGRITGDVHLETDDGGADFQGTALIEVPVLRYSQETVNAQAQYELDLQDANLRRDALAAQARQYAAVKQREFIERHEALDDLRKIVFEALIRNVCTSVPSSHHSYYKEIIARTIDWTRAKMEFESARLNSLAFPDFPPDHFTNSLAVRMFLPVLETAEDTLFDVLHACGSFQVRLSVEYARDRIAAERERLQQDGPDELDEFSTELMIGEHIEAVMSDHDLAK